MSESFPSPDFAQKVEAAQTRIDTAKGSLEELQNRLDKQRRNRESLELAGKNPDAEITRTRDEIKSAEIEVGRATEAMRLLFSDERGRHAPTRQEIWETKYVGLVRAGAAKLEALVSTLRLMSKELVALRASPAADTLSASTIDAGVAALNELVVKHRLPSNFLLDPKDSLAFCFQYAVRDALKKSELDAALKELREQLESLENRQPVSRFESTVITPPGTRKLWAGR